MCHVQLAKNADWDPAEAFGKQWSARNFRPQVNYDQTVYTKSRFRQEIRKRKVVYKLGGFQLWRKKMPINWSPLVCIQSCTIVIPIRLVLLLRLCNFRVLCHENIIKNECFSALFGWACPRQDSPSCGSGMKHKHARLSRAAKQPTTQNSCLAHWWSQWAWNTNFYCCEPTY